MFHSIWMFVVQKIVSKKNTKKIGMPAPPLIYEFFLNFTMRMCLTCRQFNLKILWGVFHEGNIIHLGLRKSGGLAARVARNAISVRMLGLTRKTFTCKQFWSNRSLFAKIAYIYVLQPNQDSLLEIVHCL